MFVQLLDDSLDLGRALRGGGRFNRSNGHQACELSPVAGNGDLLASLDSVEEGVKLIFCPIGGDNRHSCTTYSVSNAGRRCQFFSMMAGPWRCSGRMMARRSPLLSPRMSCTPYFIIASRVRPSPKAKPVYARGSMPPARSTLG